ncbi:SPFH domain-containing protein [Streptococcus pneumoniae]
MGIIKAFSDAITGTFADQWKEIITAGYFDEHTAVSPGVIQQTKNGRGANIKGSDGVITNGSKIFIPENTAAFIFSQGGIEDILTEPGGYEYTNGESSIFNGDSIKKAIFNTIGERIGYGGQSSSYKQIAFVNLREIRDIRFGTRGAVLYHDLHYGTDLEIRSFGTFSIKITEPEVFIRNYVPANVNFYSFDDKEAREQMIAEFLQSFIVALNSLSTQFRISQLPSQTNTITQQIANDTQHAGTWKERFGFEIVQVAIANIEFSPESKELVRQYSANKMNINAYEHVSQRVADIAAQQKIADGVQQHGLGDSGSTIFGMNMGNSLDTRASSSNKPSFDEQIEMLTKLKSLLDAGILSQEEFETKKKEIMDL